MSKLTIYHGSSQIIKAPLYGVGPVHNDYGQGFYCTEHLELAREWSSNKDTPGYVNCYELELEGLHILNLSDDRYTVLHWLALLVNNRTFQMKTPLMYNGAAWLKEWFLPDISEADVIIGYRADDSYFGFARAFLTNQISLAQLSYAMRLGKLGEQVMLKSEKAFQQLTFIGYETVMSEYYFTKKVKRDLESREAFHQELKKSDYKGIFLNDIIREEMKPDDVRLR